MLRAIIGNADALHAHAVIEVSRLSILGGGDIVGNDLLNALVMEQVENFEENNVASDNTAKETKSHQLNSTDISSRKITIQKSG